MGNLKKYLFDHPVASVFLAWTGADIVRMGVNLIRDVVHCKHIERVNVQRINAGARQDDLTYGGATSDDDKTEETEDNTEQTKEES